nr:hypothetical protein [Myxococcus sp. AS-1-15]
MKSTFSLSWTKVKTSPPRLPPLEKSCHVCVAGHTTKEGVFSG